jgi:hypothetical protein
MDMDTDYSPIFSATPTNLSDDSVLGYSGLPQDFLDELAHEYGHGATHEWEDELAYEYVHGANYKWEDYFDEGDIDFIMQLLNEQVSEWEYSYGNQA